jgi:hypothetical protein
METSSVIGVERRTGGVEAATARKEEENSTGMEAAEETTEEESTEVEDGEPDGTGSGADVTAGKESVNVDQLIIGEWRRSQGRPRMISYVKLPKISKETSSSN